MSFNITFLGTGGGRFTTMFQLRSTGGLLVENEGHFIHIDPGPGALLNAHRIHHDLAKTEAVIVSHQHPDHYSDQQNVIEGMTKGGMVQRGEIYGSVTVMEGLNGLGPVISNYHLKIADKYVTIKPGDSIEPAGLKIDICKAIHTDTTNVGFRMHTQYGDVSYLSDTEYSEEIAKQYVGSRVLILPVTMPYGSEIRGHMSGEGAEKICKIVKPELCLFLHLGIAILTEDPAKHAQKCEKNSGVKTIALNDLDRLEVGKEIRLTKAKTYPDDEFWIPDW